MFKALLVLQGHRDRQVLKVLKDSSVRKELRVLVSLDRRVYRADRVFRVPQALVSQVRKVCKVYRELRVFKVRLARRVLWVLRAHKVAKGFKVLKELSVHKVQQARRVYKVLLVQVHLVRRGLKDLQERVDRLENKDLPDLKARQDHLESKVLKVTQDQLALLDRLENVITSAKQFWLHKTTLLTAMIVILALIVLDRLLSLFPQIAAIVIKLL